uniref:Uncharacterized protein n=1 Tax=Anguilla anguilla TaxID=7936 RepID=A0A0E9VIQ9_ANGAN
MLCRVALKDSFHLENDERIRTLQLNLTEPRKHLILPLLIILQVPQFNPK